MCVDLFFPGEKPYKCVYCNYAAAQKTSLKYHLDRHHKDKRYAEIPSRPLASPVDGKPREDIGNCAESGARPPAPGGAAAVCSPGASEDSCESVDSSLAPSNPGDALVQMNVPEIQKLIPVATYSLKVDEVSCPTPAHLKKDEIREERSDTPLNLSLKVCFSAPLSAESTSALVPVACQFCPYKTFYPEVLIMHKRLVHKDKATKKSGFGGGGVKHKRLTGCPPALDGKDVAPLPMFGGHHPRRTKSPLRPAAKPKQKLPVNPPLAPVRPPLQDVQETQPQRNGDPAARPPPSRYAELPRKAFPGSSRPGPPDRPPLTERSCPSRGGVIWHSDAARLCLSSQYGPLPPMDFGEPSSKRLKYAVAPCREADPGVFRGPLGAAPSRLLIPGRGGKTTSQIPPVVSENLGPSAAIGGGLDSDWSMMGLLSSYSANDLASLYHSAPPPPAHVGLANPRAGRC